jgi:VWFA-related protein
MLTIGLMLMACLLCWSAARAQRVAAAQQDAGVHLELPPGGVVHVENRRGDVLLRVWDEKYVSVTALRENVRVVARRSPVIVGRTERSLSINVARGSAAESGARIDLEIRVPRGARTEIVTTNGTVMLNDVPARLQVQTTSGDIRAEFVEASSIRLLANTPRGKLNDNLTGGRRAVTVSMKGGGGDSLFWTSGDGTGADVILRSESGKIDLKTIPASNVDSSSAVQANVTQQSEPAGGAEVQQERQPQRPPLLIGARDAGTGAGTPAAPGSNEPQEIDEGDVLRVDTELVTLNMSVVDRSTNRGVTGLTATDFKLYEDGAPQQLAHFESSSAPFDLVLLIDMSGSTRDVVKLIRAAALRFVNTARPTDRIGVITFAGSPTLVSPLTVDRTSLRERISQIETPRGDTKLYDALAYTMQEVLKETRESRRTAIVLMSDGLDGTIPGVHGQVGSRLGYNELLGSIREFDGVLYTLWLNTEYEAFSPEDTQPEAFEMGHDRMREMAEAGGGIFYEVEKLEDLAGAYEHVVADLGTVYSLSYRPTNSVRDGRWRSIRVTVARPGAVARGKHGYYAK